MAFKKAKAQEARPVIACAHEGCEGPAIVNLKSANLCKGHLELHISQQARDFCDKKGLITRSQKREWCLNNMPKFGRRLRLLGEDDEEVAA